MQPDFMYAAVASDEVDVIAGYTSDGLIAKYDLVVLDDPKHAIPPYDAIVLLSPKRAGDQALRAALTPLLGAIDIATMREANCAPPATTPPVRPPPSRAGYGRRSGTSRVGKGTGRERVRWRAHHSAPQTKMVGTAQGRLCPPYELAACYKWPRCLLIAPCPAFASRCSGCHCAFGPGRFTPSSRCGGPLSGQGGAHRAAVCGRWRRRYHSAGYWETATSSGNAFTSRITGRRRHRRGPNGDRISARRPYAGAAVQWNRGQRFVVQKAAVRSAAGFRAGVHSGLFRFRVRYRRCFRI